ncbi:TonB-dependent receptor [Methyloversatilis sp.]|uniref:TonB-dependent receptor n=1 Tax=Methyloversatilis sp. TaxID=2569862 RepID=UPI0027377B04|nr:TonB-dependent receptor [Methyloversatilis sp.]MDP2869328.1 TonB-dependent receptor [Methyloversatilis sp.]MDP3454273.1 TonB-dependent receptor [Methyloversatilis sp.]MDP3579696.1 TonB-dependent receptor [Methyloversatilis sp.]
MPLHPPLRAAAPPIAIALLCAFPAAQAADADKILPSVTVTATGYAMSDNETPIATTALDRTELDRRGSANVGEALRGEPGIAVASDSAQGQNPVIRGLGRDSIVLLVDGMRFNSAQPAGAIASFMSLGLAEMVEVVRGGASVLYGTGALGGAINVLLPQAKFVDGARIDAGARFDSASEGLRGTAVTNIGHGDHALMIGVSTARIGDYDTPDGKAARTGYDSDALIGQYRFRIDGEQQLRVSAQLHRDEDVWYPGSTRPHPSNPASRSTTVRSPGQERSLFELGYSLQAGGDRPLNLDVRLYRQNMQRQIFAYANWLGRDIVTTRVDFETDGFDARGDWLVHPQHLLSAGVNAWEMRADPNRQMAAAPAFATFAENAPFDDARVRAIGAYVQDDMRFGALNVLAGLRHDKVTSDADSMSNGARTTGLAGADSALSGSLGAIYRITPLLRPYASYARAFRAPGMRERYESGLRGDGYFYAGSPEVEAEKADQFELGIKGSSDDFAYSLSAYHNRIDNYLTGRILSGAEAIAACGGPNAANCKKNVNLGSATIRGIEASLRWQIARGHWLSAAYSALRGDNDDLDEPLFQMPADELSLGWTGKVLDAVRADFTLRLVDRQDRVATVFTRGAEDETAGFVTADAGFTIPLERSQSLRVAVRNLADKTYHEHLADGLSGQELRAVGRSLQVSWRGSF